MQLQLIFFVVTILICYNFNFTKKKTQHYHPCRHLSTQSIIVYADNVYVELVPCADKKKWLILILAHIT